MKKRLVLSLLSILLVSLLFSPDMFSQETPATVVRVAPHPLSPYYDLHPVDIVIENGQAVTGYQVMLQYDSDYIEYVSIDHGNYLPDDLPDDPFFGDAQIRDTDPDDPLKAILFAATAFPNRSEGDGVLATLTFKTIRDEPSDLTLLDVTLLSHGVDDDKVVLSSPQLKNSSTHVVVESSDIEKIVQATYSHEGVFLFLGDPEPITTLEEMVEIKEPDNLRYDLNRDEDITVTDLAWMHFAVRLDVNDDKKIDTKDRRVVTAAIGKTGIRPEDVNSDEVVNIQDITLVNTAILAVENLPRLWSDLPVKEVVQATYSHEGVFLFSKDPETAVVTLEEMVRRNESGLRYDLDKDGKITSTDLEWMRFAVKLDVNNDEKIDTQDKEAVKAAIGKTGIRPEDVNGDEVVSNDDEFLVNTAILAIENLSLLPQNNVRRVVQATYSYEGVFLFGEDPETAVVTLEEMVRRDEWAPDYDLDGDGKITSTDLEWMRFAVRLDVNGDGKIDWQDQSTVQAVQKGWRPAKGYNADVNGDGVVTNYDMNLVNNAIKAVNRMAKPAVQVIWYHPSNVKAYIPGDGWDININTIMPDILEPVQEFYKNQLNETFDLLELKIIQSSYDEEYLGELATDAELDLFQEAFEDIRLRLLNQSAPDILLTKDIYLVVVQSQETNVSDQPGNVGAAYCYDNVNAGYGSVLKTCPYPFTRLPFTIVSTGNTGWGWLKTQATTIEKMKIRIAHELGHNFGLYHTFSPDLIMGYSPADELNLNYFTKIQKEWLHHHPVFNNPGRSRGKDALFSVGNLDTSLKTLEIKVTTQSGLVGQSVSQFVVTTNGYEVVEMWKGKTSDPIPYDGRNRDTEILISTIDTDGHISSWGVTLPKLIPTAFPAPLHVSLLPERTGLLPNYPNPFNPETWIPYQLANPADVALTIYDIQGRVVRDLDLGHQHAGTYHSRARAAYWDGRNAVGEAVASGVYFYTLKAGDFTATRKMLIRK